MKKIADHKKPLFFGKKIKKNKKMEKPCEGVPNDLGTGHGVKVGGGGGVLVLIF